MNRRRFLELLGVGFPALVAPKKTYFFLEGLWRPDLAFHKDAFALVWPGLHLPVTVPLPGLEFGFSVKVLRQYDEKTDRWPARVDVLYGCADQGIIAGWEGR